MDMSARSSSSLCREGEEEEEAEAESICKTTPLYCAGNTGVSFAIAGSLLAVVVVVVVVEDPGDSDGEGEGV
jgi:hypothetical protein